ncbi:GTP cyclohydrolase, FolE2/MptA family, partial [Escherichia coli]|uniref:GTP cyclohydrolase, FolE2/MptA family n=1 Tax=Escherichia coli TaxID=562 RepID=UPI0022AF565D
MTKELAKYMEQSQAELHVTYPWFYKREAPATGSSGLNHSLASIQVSWSEEDEPVIKLGLEVQVTTLCPCSKEISEYSAHNQRGTLTIEVQGFPSETIPMYWKEELLNA